MSEFIEDKEEKVASPFCNKKMYDFGVFVKRWFTTAERLQMAKDLLNYVRDHNECLNVGEFFVERKLNRATFNRWCREEDELKVILEEAKHVLGLRREKYAILGGGNAYVIMKTMYMYLEEYDEANRYSAELDKLKPSNEDLRQAITVISSLRTAREEQMEAEKKAEEERKAAEKAMHPKRRALAKMYE